MDWAGHCWVRWPTCIVTLGWEKSARLQNRVPHYLHSLDEPPEVRRGPFSIIARKLTMDQPILC